MGRSLTLALGLLLVVGPAARGQSPVRDYRKAHERELLAEFAELLAIPNVASDRANIRRNAEHIVKMMGRRGLAPRLLEAGAAGAPPAVYGEWKVEGAARTVVLYAHYDGQPTDPKQWAAGLEPWRPTLRT
ncbi:MAG TPA: hypothetical protein VK422_18790, partial [Pyrinomonadaceae bacterium]|nr:hypothetical protein [Pyrinomonadaceae bacterium]